MVGIGAALTVKAWADTYSKGKNIATHIYNIPSDYNSELNATLGEWDKTFSKKR
jgi:hypothetical protein